MKLLNALAEEVSEFDQPAQSEAQKFHAVATKVRSLSHHRSILVPKLHALEDLNDQGKLTPLLRAEIMRIQAKLKTINDLFKQFDIKVGKNKIPNPAAKCELALYAGSPEQYPDLTGSQVKLLGQIQAILKAAGIPPLTILYGGRLSKQYAGINFVAMNANQTFAWRKYDPSPGAGQNWVYFPGKESGSLKTSEFVASPKKFLKLFKP